MIPIPAQKNSELEDLKKDLENFKKLEIEKHMKFYAEKLDESLKKIQDFEVIIASLKNVEKENEFLKKEIDCLTYKVNDIEQNDLKINVEIRGAPFLEDVSDDNILQAVAQEISCPIEKKDIEFCYRVGKKSDNNGIVKHSSIVVKFKDFEKKQEFKIAANKLKEKTKMVKIKNNNFKVFVNDHLTPLNKILLNEAKIFSKEKNFKFTWVKNCNIYIKKETDSDAICVRKICDINAIPVPIQNLKY